MESARQIAKVLGGPDVLGKNVTSLEGLRRKIRDGLPVKSLHAVGRILELADAELSAALDVPPRTMARRKKAKKLPADQSDRLYRLARVAAIAVRVLGSQERAAEWLRRPNRALGGNVPLSILDTTIGARQVEDVLGRIEHGVFS